VVDINEALGAAAPAELAVALRERQAHIVDSWSEGRRHYAIAGSPTGRLFARFSTDPADGRMFEHEAAVRARVGSGAALRSPPVLARGDSWLLEEAVGGSLVAGAASIDGALDAASQLADLALPELPSRSRPLRTLNRRWRAVRSPLPTADIRAAREIRARSPLPLAASHGDFVPENLLFDGTALWVIDWELSGQRPMGSDLMQLWSMLESADDRERLFEGAVRIVGARSRGALLALRYAVVVATISGLFAAPSDLDRDGVRGGELLGLLPELRAEAR
jgi:hypothetical protein